MSNLVPASPLVLASASPRRLQLLQQLGFQPQVRPADIDESVYAGEHARDYVRRMAMQKAHSVAAQLASDCLVLGADTSVVVDDDILGKPENQAHAAAMLRRLSNRDHEVLSAVCLLGSGGEQTLLSVTRVFFRALSEAEIVRYWQSGEPQGKAGGYAIQGHGAVFIRHIEGSYSGVMGLPLFETAQVLRQRGLEALP